MHPQRFIQWLENRHLLSANFASISSHGTLSITGTMNDDAIVVSVSRGKIVAGLNGNTISFAPTSVKRIDAFGFRGDDIITNHVPVPSTLVGGDGNDSLTGTTKVDDLLPGSGDNVIDGGGARDILDYSDQSATEFDIENDPNVLPPSGAQTATINGDTLLHCRGDELLGTPGNDSFTGMLYDTLDMTIAGGNGNDTLGIFVDELYPEDPGITLDGGNGNDRFETGDTVVIPDRIVGGPGNDYLDDNVFFADDPEDLDMGPGHDTVEETESPLGPITLFCAPGVEDLTVDEVGSYKLIGNDLDNTITVASSGGTTIDGGAGNDTLECLDDSSPDGAEPNFMFGGDGKDHLTADSNFGLGGPTQTVVNGQNGNDTLDGSGGANRILNGGPGSDLLIPAAVDYDFDAKAVKTTLIGGQGNDTADFSYDSLPLTITLDNKSNDGVAGSSVNVHSDIETVLGGSGNDRIVGDPFANLLKGNAGNDTIFGGAGNDTLDGGAGRDALFGQDGTDLFFAKDGRTDSLDGGAGFDSAQRDNSASIKDQVLAIEKFV